MYMVDFMGGQSSISAEITRFPLEARRSFLHSLGLENEGQEWSLDGVDKVEDTLLIGS